MTAVHFPDVGEPVELAFTDGQDVRTYSTWVDKGDGFWMSVFAPHDILVADIPAVGTQMMVRWHDPRGRFEVDATFLGADEDGGTQWELDLGDEITLTQNRLYVRGGGGEPARLRMLTPDELPAPQPAPPALVTAGAGGQDASGGPGEAPEAVAEAEPEPRTGPDPTVPVEGMVVDLSERGARCRFRQAGVLPEDPVELIVQLDGRALTLHGTVLRLIPDAPGGRTDVVVVYEPDEETAATVRRHVLQSQFRARQRTRG